jgi:hypothetical protein
VTRVNPYFVDSLLRPWSGLADDDDEIDRYAWVDPNDESTIRRVIVQDVVPYVARWDDEGRAKTKLALQFALTFATDWFFERSFDSCLPPFEAPTPARRLFELAWEELFGDEDCRLPGSKSDYEINDDLMEPNQIRVRAE